MEIIARISQLILANVNDLLDRAEDPEKMLNQILRDMESGRRQARQQVIEMIAVEKSLEADLARNSKLSLQLQTTVVRAIDAGKDEIAREALRRRRDADEIVGLGEGQLVIQHQTVTRLKELLRALDAKYSRTLSQRDGLVARQKRAEALGKFGELFSEFSPADPTAELGRMERKIRASEARAAAQIEIGDNSVTAQIREFEIDADLELELQLLKAGRPANSLSESSSHEVQPSLAISPKTPAA